MGSRAVEAGGTFRDGSNIARYSTKAGGPGDTGNNPNLVSMAKSAPNAPDYAGCCAEIHVLSQAIDKGIDVAGGMITSVTAATGGIREPCSACSYVMDKLGVTDGAKALLDESGITEALKE